MKKILSIFCVLSIVALLSACDNGKDKGGTSGTTIPEVSYDLFTTSDWVTCYNADQSVVTNPTQSCIWKCATLNGSAPHYYKFVFLYDEATGDHSVADVVKETCRL